MNHWGKCVFSDWVWITAAAVGNKRLFLSLRLFFFFNHFRQWEHSTRTWLSYHEQPHWGFRCNVLNTSELYYKKLLLHNLKANRKWRLRAFVPVNYVTQSTTLLSGKTQLSLLKNEVEGRCSSLSVILWDSNLTLACPIWATTPTRNCLGRGRSCGLLSQTWRRCVIIRLWVTLSETLHVLV